MSLENRRTARWTSTTIAVGLVAVAIAAGCGEDEQRAAALKSTPTPDPAELDPALRRDPAEGEPPPRELFGRWVGRGENDDTTGRVHLRPAGHPLCVELLKSDAQACYAGEPVSGPGAKDWKSQNRGRWVEYGPVAVDGDVLVMRAWFAPVYECIGTQTRNAFRLRGDRLALRPRSELCPESDPWTTRYRRERG